MSEHNENKLRNCPGDWMVSKLGDARFFSLKTGGTPSTEEPAYWDGDIPWLSSGEVNKKRITYTDTGITQKGFNASNATFIPAGSVLIALAGQGKTRGTAATNEIELTTNQSVAAVIPDNQQIDPEYLYQYLDGEYEELRASSGGAGRAGLSLGILQKYRVLIPRRLSEQRKISAILHLMDDGISRTESLIAKYQQIKAGLMHDLFTRGVTADGNLRPPREQAPELYQETPIGWIPKEWQFAPSSSVCEKICVGIVIKPAQYYVQEGIPAFRSANIREWGINAADLVFISRHSNELLSKSQVKAGDVLSVRTGYPGTSAVVPPEFDGANCVDILISRPTDRIDSEFLCYWINSPFGKDQVLKGQGGLAQQHFNVGEMRNLIAVLPDIEEQRRIVERLSTIDKRLRCDESQLTKLGKLKQGLMHDLLTGEVRVKLNEDSKEAMNV